MAYIPFDPELKVKGKAAVDVIGGRGGKSARFLYPNGLAHSILRKRSLPARADHCSDCDRHRVPLDPVRIWSWQTLQSDHRKESGSQATGKRRTCHCLTLKTPYGSF